MIVATLMLTVLSVTLFALPLFAEPIRSQTQERGEDCPQTCEPCGDCICDECDHDGNQYRHQNAGYRTCGDCGCDGTQKQVRAGQTV